MSKGKDVLVCLPGARIEHVTQRVDKIIGRGKGGTILVHVGTNNADKEGTTAIVDKYRTLADPVGGGCGGCNPLLIFKL